MKSTRLFFLTAIVGGTVLCQSAVNAFGQLNILQQLRSGSPVTTKGESVCVGKQANCQNESVVYRFEAVPNKSDGFIVYADKIVKEQRVPSHVQELKFDERSWTFTSAPTSSPLYGFWEYTVASTGEIFSGLFHILPGNVVARRVKLKVVDPGQVPAAPDRASYGSLYGLNNTNQNPNASRQPLSRVLYEEMALANATFICTDCKGDIMIFRFEPAADRRTVFTVFVDKLVNGKRIPLFRREELEYDERSGGIQKLGSATLVLQDLDRYFVDPKGQTLTWTSYSSDGSVARRIKLRRVDARSLPAGSPNRLLYSLIP